jgi:2-phospho-L-lactate guanylyltransferase
MGFVASPSEGPLAGGDAVLVPVKAFRRAKLRLAPALSPKERRDLARSMATRVVISAGALPVAVVCDDEEVAGWASGLGAEVLWEPGKGLNGAVQSGFARLVALGAESVTVAASDLPLASNLARLADRRGVTVVPDRRGDGTNVISLRAGLPFRFGYGPGSFGRHVSEARQLGVPVRVVRSPELAWDVDLPEDLAGMRR